MGVCVRASVRACVRACVRTCFFRCCENMIYPMVRRDQNFKHKTKVTDLSQTAPIFYIELLDNERMSHQSLH